tara:strand:+ start:1286 stop:1615 length:330 start_codon:yes stop_codon:yes gene_type:complete
MSEFFESEIVREELEDINSLQKEIYAKIMNISSLSLDDQKEHVEKLEILLEKQQLMYTRVSLSDDPEAVKMKKHLEESVSMLGFPEGTDIRMLFSHMSQTIKKLREKHC